MEHKEGLKYQTYVKRPVIVEAMQFTRNNWEELKEFGKQKVNNYRCAKHIGAKAICDIKTLEGNMTATEGDYIIRGVFGEYYPCKEEIFNITYEKL